MIISSSVQLGTRGRWSQLQAARRFASAADSDHSFSADLTGIHDLSDLSRFLKLRKSELSVSDALHLTHTTLRLKHSSDKSLRGRIPKVVVRTASQVLLPQLDSLSTNDLVSLILVVGDNQQCLDEFLMYRAARVCSKKLHLFTVKQCVQIAGVYSKQDLGDEELLRGIGKRIANDEKATLSELVRTLRSLSKMGIREDDLITRVLKTARGTARIWEKDAVTLVIAMAELDEQDHDICRFLWDSISAAKQPISHDDEYYLLFAFLWNPFPNTIIQKIIDRATKDNRIRKRLQLLSDSDHYGLIPDFDFYGLRVPSLPAKVFRSDHGMNLEGGFDDRSSSPFSMSSGLHMEVINVLRSLGQQVSIEVPTSSFIIDAVLPP